MVASFSASVLGLNRHSQALCDVMGYFRVMALAANVFEKHFQAKMPVLYIELFVKRKCQSTPTPSVLGEKIFQIVIC